MCACGPGAAMGAAVGAVDGAGAADVCWAVADGADVLGGGGLLGAPMQPVIIKGSRHTAVRLIASVRMSITPQRRIADLY
ncbi:MAG: hypothetical protein NVS4B6_19420 [Mycobacterium sp.]